MPAPAIKRPQNTLSLSQSASSPLELSLLVLIAGLAAVLRFHSLAAKSFWFDEGVSVAIARLDWYNFARILWRREANMSLYYFLLHFWLYFGGSEFFVRALSVLFAVASVPVIYLLGRRLFDSRVGLIAAALMAVNAYHVQYSQDARSYSLMVLLCLLSSLYFLKCLERAVAPQPCSLCSEQRTGSLCAIFLCAAPDRAVAFLEDAGSRTDSSADKA